jgi:hypothetical protein
LPPVRLAHVIVKRSIFEATNGGTGPLSEVVGDQVASDDSTIVVVQVAIPGEVMVKLGSTPDDSVESNIVEATIVIAITTWENQR